MEKLQVHMLGRFSIETQGRRIDDSENRSQKPWLLLAYMLYHRSRVVTQEELLRLCWGNEEIKGDPANALRVVLHRARTLLDKLEILPGRELILRSRDGFQWNDRVPVSIDVEELETLYAQGRLAGDPKQKCDCFERAIGCYGGDFLSRNAGDPWRQFMAEKFKKMYLEMALEVLGFFSAAGEVQKEVELCRRVLVADPYCEEVYCRLMEALLKWGRPREAAEVYERFRTKILSEFDRLPEKKTNETYFSVLRELNPPSVPIELERLDIGDGNESQGAKLCDFSFYRMFYSSAKWLIEQCGLSLYDVIFTMEARADKIISERIRERLMEGLTQQLRLGLSRGDALARYTDNQIIGMVQASGYEQACLICERQVGRFYQEHPNVPVRLSYGVWRVGGEKR